MGKTIISCGHEDSRKPFGYMLHRREEVCDAVDGFSNAVVSGSYCSLCAAWWLANHPEDTWTDYNEAEREIFG